MTVNFEKSKTLQKNRSRFKEEEDKKKSQFIKNISSNLQLPLNQLIQLANIALRRIRRKQTELASDYLVEMKWISEEIIIYINDLLELSQLKAGESEFSMEEIDIVHYLQTIRRQFLPIADNRKINFSFTPENIKQPCILADYSKLSKVINILLRNAFRHTQDAFKKTQEKNTIEIQATQKHQTIYISIYDSGLSKLPKEEAVLFNSYDENVFLDDREKGMTDFSLSICKELMAGQNGNIQLDRTDKKNPRFILSLPTAQTILD